MGFKNKIFILPLILLSLLIYILNFDSFAIEESNKLTNVNISDYLKRYKSFDKQWGLKNSGQTYRKAGTPGIDINYVEYLKIMQSGHMETVKIAVLDTYIYTEHKDLEENILLINGSNKFKKLKNIDINDEKYYHGTHIAGIIGASHNGTEILGIVPKVKIIPLNIMSNEANIDTIIEAIEYAEKMGARVVNCSWSVKEYSEELYNTIKDSNMLFVVAAGNDSKSIDEYPLYPASFNLKNVITVASIDNTGELSNFSNYGNKVSVAAPGEYIYSTLPNNQYGYSYGTSIATAFVTGLAGLIFSVEPTLKAEEVVSLIERGVLPLESLKGKIKTSGIINVSNTLNILECSLNQENRHEDIKENFIKFVMFILHISRKMLHI